MLQFSYKLRRGRNKRLGGGMFGLGNDQNQKTDAQAPAAQAAAAAPTNDPAIPTTTVTAAPTATPPVEVAASAPSAPTIPDPMVTPATTPATAPETNSIDDVNMGNGYIEPAVQIGPAKASVPNNVPSAASMITTSPAPVAADDSLAQVRQQAINSLQPLVGHLDQAPEDKFKTLMMLIQTSDNSKLLNDAYEAANRITDEKARAQALLDVINEINYFNHQQANK